MASVFAGTATHPIDTCKIRMQIQPIVDGKRKYTSLPQAIYVIYHEEGLRKGIYKGLEGSCMREASYSTLRLGLYEPIKRLLGAEEGQKQALWQKFGAAGLSGMIGSAIANPADLLKTRA